MRKQKAESRKQKAGRLTPGHHFALEAAPFSNSLAVRRLPTAYCFLPTAFCLLLSAFCLPSAKAHERVDELPDEIMKRVGFDQRLDQQVPLDLSFRDERGQVVKLQDYFGKKPVMLVPLYYKCGMLCPEEMHILIDSLKDVQFNPGQQYEIVVLSIDPRETPADAAGAKSDWVHRFDRPGTEQGWHLLTGQEDAIEKLTQAIGFRYVYDTRTNQYAHPDGLVLLTPRGKIARYFYSLNYPARDLRFGLIEASENKIGSPIDVFFLSCYHYNPGTGKYNIAVISLVRWGAVLTMLSLGGFVSGMLLLEKWRKGKADTADLRLA